MRILQQYFCPSNCLAQNSFRKKHVPSELIYFLLMLMLQQQQQQQLVAAQRSLPFGLRA